MSIAETATDDLVALKFTGTRRELFGRLLSGYLLMLPTLGLYRFWVTTAKRRFYWKHTEIDGDPLEYTGSAMQLLIGFLFAIAVFLPLYALFFYLSTQSSTVAVVGYGAVALLLWFLSGYAIYRGRDFRLSRTLWRGVRFGQEGSAMSYAVRRFGWSLLVLLTLGLAYPFMAASLWRYRYRHTRFGDRAFAFAGSWRTIAGPFYKAYLAIVIAVVILVVSPTGGRPALLFATTLLALVALLGFVYFRSREASRMFSALSLGDTRLTVRVRARTLLGQFVVYGLALLGLFLLAGGIAVGISLALRQNLADLGALQLGRSGWAGVVLVVGGYLAGLASFSLLGEVFLDCGYWMAVSRGSTLSDIDSLSTVRATAEDKAVVGEGLADALNVGSF